MYGDGEGVTVLGGGTILLPEMAMGRVRPGRTLMLHRSGLDTIREEGDRVVIGAMVPIAKLVDHPEPSLAAAASHIADGEVRRNATVGGNLCAGGGSDAQREIRIVELRVPGVPERLAEQAARFAAELRVLDLQKPPGLAETIDWVRALNALGQQELDVENVQTTLGSLLKYHEDLLTIRDEALANLVERAGA